MCRQRSARDVNDVPSKVDQYRQQRSQLDDRDRCGRLLRLERCLDASVQTDQARRENKVCSGTNGNEFG